MLGIRHGFDCQPSHVASRVRDQIRRAGPGAMQVLVAAGRSPPPRAAGASGHHRRPLHDTWTDSPPGDSRPRTDRDRTALTRPRRGPPPRANRGEIPRPFVRPWALAAHVATSSTPSTKCLPSFLQEWQDLPASTRRVTNGRCARVSQAKAAFPRLGRHGQSLRISGGTCDCSILYIASAASLGGGVSFRAVLASGEPHLRPLLSRRRRIQNRNDEEAPRPGEHCRVRRVLE